MNLVFNICLFAFLAANGFAEKFIKFASFSESVKNYKLHHQASLKNGDLEISKLGDVPEDHPTQEPTEAPVSQFTFDATVGVGGLPSAHMDSTTEDSLIATLCVAFNLPFDEGWEVTDRHFEEHDHKYTSEMIVKFTVDMDGEHTMEEYMDSYVIVLHDAFSDGSWENFIINEAAPEFHDTFLVSPDAEFTEPTVSHFAMVEEEHHTDSRDGLSNEEVAGIAIGICMFFFLVVVFACIFSAYRGASDSGDGHHHKHEQIVHIDVKDEGRNVELTPSAV